ncbi:hypothetical protein JMJ77_0004944 [Colletotrichum scovillei]|uniref:Uncharacterized protein n=1 Tax=Colletotrichum scovillei TaxID=1209932 RepID=A0A9P7RJM2_9PEZI|nr:hypothetical protein JMJ77_0004944 [Colletotrichum scovillei]KAG7076155.1 hypothetical protein JMJ76_0013423 [Colletotrichum scovillei]KAG7083292.1 hypothetical protein JMJ78_0008739 [Colletotrichum scovillei]
MRGGTIPRYDGRRGRVGLKLSSAWGSPFLDMSFAEVDACLLSGSRRQPTYLGIRVEALWNWLGLDGPRKGMASGGANPVPLASPAGWPRNDKNLPKSIDHVIKPSPPSLE